CQTNATNPRLADTPGRNCGPTDRTGAAPLARVRRVRPWLRAERSWIELHQHSRPREKARLMALLVIGAHLRIDLPPYVSPVHRQVSERCPDRPFCFIHP